MKKRIASFALTLVMVLTAVSVVAANPGQNPNQNPGGPEVNTSGVTITVTGGGNNLTIRAIYDATGEVVVVPRTGNGTFTQTFEVFDRVITINVQGNSLVGLNVAPTPEFEDAARAFCRYTTYVYVWNRLWTGVCPYHGGAFANAPFLAQQGGTDHYLALLAHHGVDSMPHFFAFNINMTATYDYWADRLEVGLLMVFSADELAGFVEQRLGVNVRFWE